MEQFLSSPVASFIFLITIVTSYMAFNDPKLMSRFILNPYRVVHDKKYETLVTGGLIHADWMHLFMNMISYYYFAFILEQVMGHAQFAFFYVLTLVASHIPTVATYRDAPQYNSLGASGAVSGIVMAIVIWRPDLRLLFMGFLPLTGWMFALLYIGYSYYAASQRRDNINHSAHLWGALAGIVFALILSDNIRGGFMNWLLRIGLLSEGGNYSL